MQKQPRMEDAADLNMEQRQKGMKDGEFAECRLDYGRFTVRCVIDGNTQACKHLHLRVCSANTLAIGG